MGDVVRMDEYRPHVLVRAIDGRLHVIPEPFLDRVIAGEAKITDLEGWETIVPSIIEDWLYFLSGGDE